MSDTIVVEITQEAKNFNVEIEKIDENFNIQIIKDKGESGDSAYQLALKNGFVGTEVEWLISLKGEQGQQGIPGEQGQQGIPGSQGIQGIQGEKGDKGDPADIPGIENLAYNSEIELSWNGATTAILTLTGDCSITYGVTQNYVKRLLLTGDYSITLPSESKIISGEYDGSKINLLEFTPAGGYIFVTISNA